jgi:hypothetical protein
MKHRVFVSYHHKNDQAYKEYLINWAEENNIFVDWSVDTGDISDDLSDEQIREKIRDEYLRDCRVTILLVGTETKYRKHVDWELYSSMYNTQLNKKSGIIVILLPSAKSEFFTVGDDNEKSAIYPTVTDWTTINTYAEFEHRYPYMPERILDNLVNPNCNIAVINWKDLTVDGLKLMIDNAYHNADTNSYDMHREMRRRNYNGYI